MENLNIFPEKLTLSEPENYHIALQWSIDCFCYSILDKKEKKYLGIRNYALSGKRDENIKTLELALNNDDLFSNSFSSATLMAQSYKAMLVPESLFDLKNLNAFLKFHHEIDDKDHIHFVSVKAAEAFIVFSIPSFIEEIVGKYHPHVKYSHHSQPLIDHTLKSYSAIDNSTIINLSFGKDFFDILITRHQKILLFNSFFYQKYSDVVYFVVNILNLFSLQPDHTKLNISGWLNEGSEIETELKKLFKTLTYVQFNLDFKYAEKMYTIPQHKFVNLLNLYHCES